MTRQLIPAFTEEGLLYLAPKVSGGRIWKFHRDRIDAWLREREEG